MIQFQTVEVDSTFYHSPTDATVKGGYPLTISINLDSEQTHSAVCPKSIADQSICFAVRLEDGKSVVRTEECDRPVRRNHGGGSREPEHGRHCMPQSSFDITGLIARTLGAQRATGDISGVLIFK